MPNTKYHWTQERMTKKIPSAGFGMGEDIKFAPTLKRDRDEDGI